METLTHRPTENDRLSTRLTVVDRFVPTAHRSIRIPRRKEINLMRVWIGPHDVENLVDEKVLIRGIRSGFRELTNTLPAPQRFHSALAGITQITDLAEVMILAPGALPSIPAFTVKVHAKYPSNPTRGLPGIQGVIHLIDAATGELLALIDSPQLTAHRTAAAGAVAADLLARPDAHSVAIIGAGVQGEWQFKYLTHVRSIDRVWVYDLEPRNAQAYAERRQSEGYWCERASTIAAAVQDADIIVTATWARNPFLTASMVPSGVHIATLGPDSPGKAEIDIDLLEQARVVCDNLVLARTMGCLYPWRDRSLPAVSLTMVLRGEVPGRFDMHQRAVFGAVGLPSQDLVAAWQVFQDALKYGRGQVLP